MTLPYIACMFVFVAAGKTADVGITMEVIIMTSIMSKVAFGLVNSSYNKAWVGAVRSNGNKQPMAVITAVDGNALSTDPRVLAITATSTEKMLVDSYAYTSGVGTIGAGWFGVYEPVPVNADVSDEDAASSQWTLLRKAQCNHTSSDTDMLTWHVSNPYGIVVHDNKMYMQDYDNHVIYGYQNVSGNSFAEYADPIYTFTPGDGWKAAGTGMDLYQYEEDDESTVSNYLVALFNSYTNVNYTYTYGNCELVMVGIDDSDDIQVVSAEVNANANNVVVKGNYAYVTSYGEQRNPGGNASSRLQVFELTGGALSLLQTIAPTAIDSTKTTFSSGDFIDVAFVNSKAYVLLTHYNSVYTKYDYVIIQTTEGKLQAGSFGTEAKYCTGASTKFGTTLGLLPGGETELYFVNGESIFAINTAVDISTAGAVTAVCAASDFTYDDGTTTATGYIFNTASTVVEKQTVTAAKAAAGVAHVSKLAKRMARPEELEQRDDR